MTSEPFPCRAPLCRTKALLLTALATFVDGLLTYRGTTDAHTSTVECASIDGVRVFYVPGIPTFRVGFTVVDAPPKIVADFVME